MHTHITHAHITHAQITNEHITHAQIMHAHIMHAHITYTQIMHVHITHAPNHAHTHHTHTHTKTRRTWNTHHVYTRKRHARTGTAILTKDFAACVDHDKKFNKTCAHPERSHEWVGVYQCSPYIHRYTDVQRKKRLKCNRDVQSEVRQKVFAIFAFSKRKGDTVFDQSVQSDLVHVMRTGKLPRGSKAEWFWRGKRLVGSCTTRPLTSKLQEASQPLPLHPELIRLVDKRDRCVNAYACVRAHVCACTWLSQPLKPLH